MAQQLAVLIEAGPKGKRFVAIARDWPHTLDHAWEMEDKDLGDAR